jgi:hypothetical protein
MADKEKQVEPEQQQDEDLPDRMTETTKKVTQVQEQHEKEQRAAERVDSAGR